MSEDLQLTELGFPVEHVEAMEEQGRWPDLTRLQARRPDKIKAAVWMLGHDVPVRDICEALSLSPCTVQKIGEVHGETVVTQKSRLTARMKLAFRLGVEKQVERAKEGKVSMFDLKLLFDMIQLTEGGATQRVEVVLSQEEQEAAQFYHKIRQDAGMVLEAEEVLARGEVAEIEGEGGGK